MKKISIIIAIVLTMSVAAVEFSKADQFVSPISTAVNVNTPYTPVNALDIVASPFKFLHRNIKIKAKFDKFTTLGLDYPAAMRSSEKYISILIQRPDVTDHNIPLSEMKIFLKRELAEKNINLDAGDEIELSGHVFSTALGDAWMDADDLKVITKKNPDKKEEKMIE